MVHPRSRLRAVQLTWISVAIAVLTFPTLGVENGLLAGHVPGAAKAARPLGRLSSDKKLNLAIGLPLRNRQELDLLVQQLYDASSPKYHQFITAGEFAKRFGPSEDDYRKLQDFVTNYGLRVTGLHPNRLLLDVSGSVADIERMLHVRLQLYQHPTEARTFYAPDVEPVALSGAPILHVSGLDNFLIPRPTSLHETTGPVPQAGSGPGGAFRGNDFRGAYARGVSLTGTGQMVGLLEFDGFYASDIAAYVSAASIPAVPIITVTMDGYDGTPGTNNNEAALDIEMVTSLAPGLSAIIMYEAGPSGMPNDILNRMATDNLAHQLSASWTYPTDATTEQIYRQFAAQGQSYFNSAGDGGAYTGAVSTPADNPNVTVVGGTTLTTTGPGGAWVSETVWNRGTANGATGGGTSTVYPIPSWQKPVDMTANHGSITMRNLPDVAAVADGVWLTYDNGKTQTAGGTSCSAPLWAAFTALVNQQAAGFGRPPVGFLNPALYSIGLGAGYNTNFHDITTGNNTTTTSPNQFFAVAGYDLCTGWGTPFGQNLINSLAPRVASPLLTNVSATLLQEGCSPPNGAIDPGETVTVNFGLKNIGGVKTADLVATLQADTGVLWPSSPQSYGALTGGGAAATRAFTFTASGPCGGTLAATLNLQDGSNNVGTLVYNFPLGKPAIVLTQNFDTVTAPALPSGWTTTASNGASPWVISTTWHDTAPNSVFADEPPVAGTEDLIAPALTIASTNAVLGFRNNFNTEADPAVANNAYDGGVLEIQIGTNDFVDILDAGGSFAAGGYTRTILVSTNTDNPLKGRRVWGGNSGGFIQTLVNLPPSAAGQTIQLRWRFAIDTGNFYGGFGWYIDSVFVRDSGSCCNPGTDVMLTTTSSPEPVGLGQTLTYSINVTNAGSQASYGLMATNSVINGTVSFLSASPGCFYITNIGIFTNIGVVCDIGTLPAGGATNYTFQVVPITADIIEHWSLISGFTPDPDLTNNYADLFSHVATNLPPVVYVQPTNALTVNGGTVAIQANAYGAGPLAYQWFFNGGPLPGQVSPSLLLTNVQPGQSGAYSVVVTNVNGATTSSIAQLTVVAAPTLTFSSSSTFSNNVAFSVPSVTGLSYTLEFKNSLMDTNWTPILPPTPGTGFAISLIDTNVPGVPVRFYRLTAQ